MAGGPPGKSGGTRRPALLGEVWLQSHNSTRFGVATVGTGDGRTPPVCVSCARGASCPVESGLPDNARREQLGCCDTVFSSIARFSFTDYFGGILFLNSLSQTPLLAATAGSFQVHISLWTNARLRLAARAGLPRVHVTRSLCISGASRRQTGAGGGWAPRRRCGQQRVPRQGRKWCLVSRVLPWIGFTQRRTTSWHQTRWDAAQRRERAAAVRAVSVLLLLLGVRSGGSTDRKVIAGTCVSARVVDQRALPEREGAPSAPRAGQAGLTFRRLAGCSLLAPSSLPSRAKATVWAGAALRPLCGKMWLRQCH